MSNEIVKKEKSPAMKSIEATGNFKMLKSSQITEVIGNMTNKFEKALNKMIDSDRFVTMITTIFDKNPALKECSVESIFGALQQTAILGLEPSPALGHCYFVPFTNNKKVGNGWEKVKEVQFQISYKGLIELARRSDEIADIYAEIIYDGDEYNIEYGLDRDLIHKPKFETDDYNNIKYAYAVAKFKDGTKTFAILTKNQLEKRRSLSPSQQEYDAKTKKYQPVSIPKGVWESHYAEMAKGKAIRALSTYLPLSTQDKQRMMIPEDTVIRRQIEEPVKEYSMDEYQVQIEEHNEYETQDVNTETGEIKEVDNMKELINQDAKK